MIYPNILSLYCHLFYFFNRDFLASIPAFADFTDQQLLLLEQRAEIKRYHNGDIIFRQGEIGENFYVIHAGTVDVCIQPSAAKLARNSEDIGKPCNSLSQGSYFGERALMTMEARAASIRCTSDELVCLVFSKETYEEVISGSSALLGRDISDNIDWSKDHETRSLFKHVEKTMEISEMAVSSAAVREVLYELTTAFTPELSVDEIVARMVMTVKSALKADRVGLFVLSEDRQAMILSKWTC